MQKGSAEQLPAEYYPGPPQYPPPAGEYPPYPPAHQQLPYQPGPWQAPSQYPPPPNYQPHDPAAGGQQGEPAYSAYPPAQQAFLPDSRPDVEGAPPEYQSPMQESDGFSEKTIRRAFIKKVYLTLAVQLVITVGIICMFIYWKTLKNWVQYNSWFSYALFITSAIYLGCTVTPILFAIAIEPLINCAASYNLRALSPVIFILIIVLACCENARRKVPGNFILLGLFTIFEGLMLGAVSALFEADAVMWAVGATTFVTLGLSLFAFQTKWDFTMASGILWVVVLVLCAFGILCAIIRSFWLQIVYASIGTLVFAVYLVVDTQLMMGGKHKYSLSPEEYIFAALNLYLDIVNLFLFILQIIGLSR